MDIYVAPVEKKFDLAILVFSTLWDRKIMLDSANFTPVERFLRLVKIIKIIHLNDLKMMRGNNLEKRWSVSVFRNRISVVVNFHWIYLRHLYV